MAQTTWIYSVMLLVISILSCTLGTPIRGHDLSFLINEKTMKGVSARLRVWIYSHNTGQHLRVVGSNINFNGSKTDPGTIMILESVNIKGHITIKSERENSLVCVNTQNGNLVMESSSSNSKGCLFVERQFLGFTQFESVFNPKWYLASKRSGHVKQPSRTGKYQKAVLFLPFTT